MILRFSCPQHGRQVISSAATTQTRPTFIIHLGIWNDSFLSSSRAYLKTADGPATVLKRTCIVTPTRRHRHLSLRKLRTTPSYALLEVFAELDLADCGRGFLRL